MLHPSKYRRYKIFGIDDLIVGGLSAVGGLANNWFAGERQEDSQNFNREEAAAARAYNTVEAQKNRDFQEQMSSSAYQRSMADMYKAGLNPILAYQKGGASSPSGATASTGAVTTTPAPVHDVIGSAVSSAQQNRRLSAEIPNMLQQNELLKAQTAQSNSSAELNYTSARNVAAQTAIKMQELSPAVRDATRADQETEVLKSGAGEIASKTGYGAGLIKPALDTVNSAVRAVVPFADRFHFNHR